MIEILYAEPTTVDGLDLWDCELWITQGLTTWRLPATAPGGLLEGELQTYFDAQEDELWGIAEVKRHPPDVYALPDQARLLRALAQSLLADVNILRAVAGLADKSEEELEQDIVAQLKLTP